MCGNVRWMMIGVDDDDGGDGGDGDGGDDDGDDDD